MANMITVCDCGHTVTSNGISTGYGVERGTNRKICFACCGEQDKNELSEKGILTGYLTKDAQNGTPIFSNWPGTFVLPVSALKTGMHNFTGKRIDFWLTFENNLYHGVVYGDNEYTTIKRIKNK